MTAGLVLSSVAVRGRGCLLEEGVDADGGLAGGRMEESYHIFDAGLWRYQIVLL